MSVSLFIWGFIQSFIVGALIPLVKKARNNYLLALIFLATALNILFQYLLRYQDLRFSVPEFLVFPDILDLILPTLVFVYINSIIGKPLPKRGLYYFYVPFIWTSVLLGYVFFSGNFSFGTYINGTFHKIDLVVVFLWKLFLFISGYRLLKSQFVNLRPKEKSLMLWPKMLVVFLGLLAFTAFTVMFRLLFMETGITATFRDSMLKLTEINYILFSCSIIFITLFFALKYPKILSGAALIRNTGKSNTVEGKKFERELNHLINEKKIFLDTELDEKKLAKAMGVHSYILSKLMNEHIGKSFSKFINEKRIQEAQRILQDPDNKDLTIFAVAVDSGFRSESVFYVNFKKLTGQTPTQYKKAVQSELKTASVSV